MHIYPEDIHRLVEDYNEYNKMFPEELTFLQYIQLVKIVTLMDIDHTIHKGLFGIHNRLCKRSDNFW